MPSDQHHKIVLLEADQPRRDQLKSAILNWGYRPFSFDNEHICLDNLIPLDPDLLISGNLAYENIISFVNSLKMIKSDLPVLLLSGDRHIQDYITINGLTDIKVTDENTSPDEIRAMITHALSAPNIKDGNGVLPLIVGNSPGIVKLKKLIPKLNQTDEAVLIQGEPGTGKELFARAIHEHSDRKNQPFIKINAVSLPYRLLENELFGNNQLDLPDFPRHKNGTLAATPRCTLFLKQVGVIPESFQSKLLQFFSSRGHTEFKASDKNTVDVRIITSTIRDLEALAEKKLFRKDLYYRMNVLTVTIPPLRDRIDDIPELTDFFCYKHCQAFGRSFYRISSETKNKFCEYHWPGNIEELQKVVKKIVLIGDEEKVLKRLVISDKFHYSDYEYVRHDPIDVVKGFSDIKLYLQKTNNYSLRSIRGQFTIKAERYLIKKVLDITNWNRKKAAELLEISYKSLLNKLKLYNI